MLQMRDPSEFEEVIKETNLHQYADKKVNCLSQGLCRKVSIALTLIGNPKIVILDEPTSNLDVKSQKDIWLLIKKLADKNKQRTIIIASQHLEEAEALASRVCILKQGQIIVDDTPSNIKSKLGA